MVRGAAKAVAKSKYAEDVLINNHTAVWGSYFDKRSFRWGFADDHSTEKNSYSTGAAGRAANDAAAAGITSGAAPTGAAARGAAEERPMLEAKTAEERAEAAAAREKQFSVASRADLYGDQSGKVLELDAEKLKAAVAKEEQFQRDAARHDSEADDKKRKYNSFTSSDVTVEEMEAYRLTKRNDFNDPMANFGKGGGMSDALLDYDGEREDDGDDDDDDDDDSSSDEERESKKAKKEKKKKKKKDSKRSKR